MLLRLPALLPWGVSLSVMAQNKAASLIVGLMVVACCAMLLAPTCLKWRSDMFSRRVDVHLTVARGVRGTVVLKQLRSDAAPHVQRIFLGESGTVTLLATWYNIVDVRYEDGARIDFNGSGFGLHETNLVDEAGTYFYLGQRSDLQAFERSIPQSLTPGWTVTAPRAKGKEQ